MKIQEVLNQFKTKKTSPIDVESINENFKKELKEINQSIKNDVEKVIQETTIDDFHEDPDADTGTHFTDSLAKVKNTKSVKEIDKAMKSDKWEFRQMALRNPLATENHISKGLDDKDWRVRESAVKNNKNVKPHQLDRAVLDGNPAVVAAAVGNPNALSRHISHGLNHRDPEVRKYAAGNASIEPHLLTKALSDKDKTVQKWAAANPKNTPVSE